MSSRVTSLTWVTRLVGLEPFESRRARSVCKCRPEACGRCSLRRVGSCLESRVGTDVDDGRCRHWPTTAPLGSETTPVIVPVVSWPATGNSETADDREKPKRISKRRIAKHPFLHQARRSSGRERILRGSVVRPDFRRTLLHRTWKGLYAACRQPVNRSDMKKPSTPNSIEEKAYLVSAGQDSVRGTGPGQALSEASIARELGQQPRSATGSDSPADGEGSFDRRRRAAARS